MPHATVLYLDGCPHWRSTLRRLRDLGRSHGLTVDQRRVTSPEEAERLGFRGSPTVLIDGIDPFATGDEPAGMTCRLYATADGARGEPDRAQLRAALERTVGPGS